MGHIEEEQQGQGQSPEESSVTPAKGDRAVTSFACAHGGQVTSGLHHVTSLTRGL